jgi:hypothetical protein
VNLRDWPRITHERLRIAEEPEDGFLELKSIYCEEQRGGA